MVIRVKIFGFRAQSYTVKTQLINFFKNFFKEAGKIPPDVDVMILDFTACDTFNVSPDGILSEVPYLVVEGPSRKILRRIRTAMAKDKTLEPYKIDHECISYLT